MYYFKILITPFVFLLTPIERIISIINIWPWLHGQKTHYHNKNTSEVRPLTTIVRVSPDTVDTYDDALNIYSKPPNSTHCTDDLNSTRWPKTDPSCSHSLFSISLKYLLNKPKLFKTDVQRLPEHLKNEIMRVFVQASLIKNKIIEDPAEYKIMYGADPSLFMHIYPQSPKKVLLIRKSNPQRIYLMQETEEHTDRFRPIALQDLTIHGIAHSWTHNDNLIGETYNKMRLTCPYLPSLSNEQDIAFLFNIFFYQKNHHDDLLTRFLINFPTILTLQNKQHRMKGKIEHCLKTVQNLNPSSHILAPGILKILRKNAHYYYLKIENNYTLNCLSLPSLIANPPTTLKSQLKIRMLKTLLWNCKAKHYYHTNRHDVYINEPDHGYFKIKINEQPYYINFTYATSEHTKTDELTGVYYENYNLLDHLDKPFCWVIIQKIYNALRQHYTLQLPNLGNIDTDQELSILDLLSDNQPIFPLIHDRLEILNTLKSTIKWDSLLEQILVNHIQKKLNSYWLKIIKDSSGQYSTIPTNTIEEIPYTLEASQHKKDLYIFNQNYDRRERKPHYWVLAIGNLYNKYGIFKIKENENHYNHCKHRYLLEIDYLGSYHQAKDPKKLHYIDIPSSDLSPFDASFYSNDSYALFTHPIDSRSFLTSLNINPTECETDQNLLVGYVNNVHGIFKVDKKTTLTSSTPLTLMYELNSVNPYN